MNYTSFCSYLYIKTFFFINFEFPKGCGLRTQNSRSPGSKLRKTGPVGIDFITLGDGGFIITKPRGSLERSPGRRGIVHYEPPDLNPTVVIRSQPPTLDNYSDPSIKRPTVVILKYGRSVPDRG